MLPVPIISDYNDEYAAQYEGHKLYYTDVLGEFFSSSSYTSAAHHH